MQKAGKWIAKHKIWILLIGFLLLVPAYLGMAATRVNYDVLSYLPDTLETVKGQDIMVDQFGMGAFSMIVVEDMDLKDVSALKEEIQQVEHVEKVLWYDSVMDISIPVEMLPKKLREAFFRGDATMMIALFDDTTSSDASMEALTQIRKLAKEKTFVSGMTGIVTDIKRLALEEMPVYVMIASLLSLVVLMVAMESFLVPLFFLVSVGIAILYNLGTNLFLGEISYITKALTAVLQLGVTMDYSIFLLNSYEENKQRFPGDRERAMSHAIANTFKSVAGSSVTTVAGFIALCAMTFALGKDMGIVMAKGVIIGVICCVTILPAMLLTFDGAIQRTKHKPLIPSLDGISEFITRHYKLWLLIFFVLLIPAVYGNNHVKVYYNIDKSLPADLESNVANAKLSQEFDMSNVHMALLKNGMDTQEKNRMLEEIKNVDGVKWALGMDSFVGPAFPETMIPKDIRKMLKSEEYEMVFICSQYKTATDEVNRQIAEIQEIVKSYSPQSMVIGEAPLTKDLADVTDVDLFNVNILSIGAIFLIITLVFKSISLPFILVAVIEFAVFVNMAIPYYQGKELVFVASIVIGTIQLGATVDYAILMTSRYQKERYLGKGKKEAIQIAHKTSMKSILISGCSFFAATFGIGLYSKVDMISGITNLLARGAVISTVVVLTILPGLFMVFDPLICRTSAGFRKKEKKSDRKTTMKDEVRALESQDQERSSQA
ncbi:MAG: MMPL family transporter [Eubacteriales bacterium]|nr:MMPL family transporter [Eubacteriales bacterium]